MKTQITTILIVCGALLASTTSASAWFNVSGGWRCIGTVSASTCYWPDKYGTGSQPYYNLDGTRNVKADTVINETEVAEIDTSGFVGNSTAAVSETELHTTELASTEFGECLVDDAPIDLEKLTGCRSDACTPNPYFNYFKYYR